MILCQLGLVAALRGLSLSGLVHSGSLILQPGFKIFFCFSSVWRQRVSLSTRDFGPRTSKPQSFVRGCAAGWEPAGAGSLGALARGPSVPWSSRKAVLHPLFADLRGCCGGTSQLQLMSGFLNLTPAEICPSGRVRSKGGCSRQPRAGTSC